MYSLLNFYLPVFQLGLEMVGQTESTASPFGGNYHSCREQALEKLKLARKQASVCYIDEDNDAAYFALVVWLDEMILRSSPPWVSEWKSNLLQKNLFNITTGGDVFFQKMAAIDQSRADLRLVYLYCLQLGFKGKYIHDNDNALRKKIIQERLICLPGKWSDWPNEGLFSFSQMINAHSPRRFNNWLYTPCKISFLTLTIVYLVLIIAGYSIL